MSFIRIAIIGIFILTFAVTLLIYPHMPDPVPSDWNAAGCVDRELPKFWGLVVVPSLMNGFTALFAVLPRIDPLRKNYLKFQSYYEGFILALAVFFLYPAADHPLGDGDAGEPQPHDARHDRDSVHLHGFSDGAC
jgi:uncharacterized membrane protein